MGPRPGSSRLTAKPTPDASSAWRTLSAIGASVSAGPGGLAPLPAMPGHDAPRVIHGVSHVTITHGHARPNIAKVRLTCPTLSRIYRLHASEDGEIGRRTSLRD